jgi:iron complex outermembrane receptor protein
VKLCFERLFFNGQVVDRIQFLDKTRFFPDVAYLDLEHDVTKKITVSAAGRFKQYSDFGNTINGKLASRYKISDNFSLRGSISSGFRAPSLAQLYFNTTFTDIVAGEAIDKINAKNNSPITRE